MSAQRRCPATELPAVGSQASIILVEDELPLELSHDRINNIVVGHRGVKICVYDNEAQPIRSIIGDVSSR
jgi:hypothetical protein